MRSVCLCDLQEEGWTFKTEDGARLCISACQPTAAQDARNEIIGAAYGDFFADRNLNHIKRAHPPNAIAKMIKKGVVPRAIARPHGCDLSTVNHHHASLGMRGVGP